MKWFSLKFGSNEETSHCNGEMGKSASGSSDTQKCWPAGRLTGRYLRAGVKKKEEELNSDQFQYAAIIFEFM